MKDADARLLVDAREALVRPLRRLAGRNDLDEAFSAWLLGPVESVLNIDGPLQQAIATGRRTARGVATLGYASASQGFQFRHREELSEGLMWLSGRPDTVAGTPASFTSDPLALLGITLGARHVADATVSSSIRTWLGRFLTDTCSRPNISPWEQALYAAASRLVDAPFSIAAPTDTSTADVRVALRSRNLLPPVQLGQADADEEGTLSLMHESADGISFAQLALRVAAFDSLKIRRNVTSRAPSFTLPTHTSLIGDGPMSDTVKNKVFISYAWDSDDHKQLVISLANGLRGFGFDTVVDAFVQGMPAEGWPAWMVRKIKWADFVLCVCTERYRRRCEGEEVQGVGKGAKWEGAIITLALYESEGCNDKFIPIFFDKDDINHRPTILLGASYYDFSKSDTFEKLLRHLTNQPEFIPVPIGSMPLLPPTDVKPFIPSSPIGRGSSESTRTFKQYCEDEFDNLRWTWKWNILCNTPHIDMIESLEVQCPKCRKRIEPRNDQVPISTTYGGRDLYGTGHKSGKYNTTVFQNLCTFQCDDKCIGEIRFPHSIDEQMKRARRHIELKARQIQ